MNTVKILKAKNLQVRINNYMAYEFNMIEGLNTAIKNNSIDNYMRLYEFRNYKVMEISLEHARVKVLRCAKIMNSISNKYNTIFCDNDTFIDICQTLDKNL